MAKITMSGKYEYSMIKRLVELFENPIIYAQLNWENRIIRVLEIVIEGEAKDEMSKEEK